MKIDFIIPWVNGNDQEWLSEKAKYQSNKYDDSNSLNRFRDWGLLRYWFRSIEKFTPWVNRIHFVTWGHLPDFLNIDHSKLNIVNHKEFIPKRYLPTFSSHAIEANIHRISELSENFVYLNDDTFIIRPMKEMDFFRDGLPCTYGGEYPIEIKGKINIWQHAAVNDLGVINEHFNKRQQVEKFGHKYRNSRYRWQDNIRTLVAEKLFPDYFIGFKNLHAPAAYRKQTFYDVWNAEPKLMHLTSSSKFRSADGVNQWVFLWWQVASGNFSPAIVDNKVSVVNEITIDSLCETIKRQSHDMLCINDPEQYVDFDRFSLKLRNAFDVILPQKSSFEK